jgi:hypothetical protein
MVVSVYVPPLAELLASLLTIRYQEGRHRLSFTCGLAPPTQLLVTWQLDVTCNVLLVDPATYD